MAFKQKVTLRHPGGLSIIETDDDFALMQKFIDWIISYNRYVKHDKNENEDVFIFPDIRLVQTCNIKWMKLCGNS